MINDSLMLTLEAKSIQIPKELTFLKIRYNLTNLLSEKSAKSS